MLPLLKNFECCSFQSHVKDKFSKKNIHIHSEDLFDLSFRKHCNESQEKCSSIVLEILNSRANINPLDKNCDSHIKFLVPLLKSKYESGFLKNLYYQISLRIGLCAHTLVHYYFLMSDRQYNYLIAKPAENFQLYRASTVLCNTIFNPHRLDTFDLKTSFQISLKKIQKTSVSTSSSYQKVHLIWLEPKVEVINSLKPENLLEFRFLVNQVMHRRTSLVLPFLQKWFYNCRDDVARFGITEATKSGILDKDQYFNLYLYLKQRPDYKNSTFLQAAASADETFSCFV